MCEIKINSDKIQKNLLFLSENTVNLDKLTLIFVQYKILDPNERERIRSENSEMNRASEMYLLLIKKVTDHVFAEVLQALKDSGNSHISDKLEAETETPDEISSGIANVGINDSYEVVGLKNDYIVLKDFKLVNPGFLKKIQFTFVQATRRDIVEGLRYCQQLESLILKDVDIKNLAITTRSDDNHHRVLLPVLKQFIWVSSESSKKKTSPKISIESLIFFYKTKNQKYWVIDDINSLQMNIFEMEYWDKGDRKRFIKMNNLEQSFMCDLVAGVDAVVATFTYYTPVKLFLSACRVSFSSLPIGNNLRELTIWDVSFQDRKSVEMSNDFFQRCQELELLDITGKVEEIVLDLNSFPPKLKRLKLRGIAVKNINYVGVVCTNLYELSLDCVRCIKNNNGIASEILCLTKLSEIKTIYIDAVGIQMIDLDSVQKNLSRLFLSSLRIGRNTSGNFLFAEQLVELRLNIGRMVTFYLNLNWIEQFKNLKLLDIRYRLSKPAITVDWKCFTSSLTNLILHRIKLKPLDKNTIQQTFCYGLKELLFLDCEFEYNPLRSIDLPGSNNYLLYHVGCVQIFETWLNQSYPDLKGSAGVTDTPLFSANYKIPIKHI